MHALAVPVATPFPTADPPPPLHPVHCLGLALPRMPQRRCAPRLFRMEQLGLPPAFLDVLAAQADSLPWDTWDVARRRRQMLERYRSILDSGQRSLLDACGGDATDPSWAGLLAALPCVLREALLRIRPHRRRSLRKYRLLRQATRCWQLQPLADTRFEQPAVAGRTAVRHFAAIPTALTYHPDMLRFVAGIAETIHAQCGATALEMAVHQMLTLADGDNAADPAPEGLHQDGADYIVSALVVRRRGIQGGLSRVRRGSAGAVLLEHELQEGEGIFQPDAGSPLWHEVSPIRVTAAGHPGQRMILGIDAHVLADAPA
jgi:hypothetical protein